MSDPTPMHAGLPTIPGLSVASGSIAAHQNALCPQEQTLVEGAADRRREQFAAGRNLARAAMVALGLPTGPVLAGERREPRWPAGMLGSITHAADRAAAVVGEAARFTGLGIDLEDHTRVTARVHHKIFTERERAAFAGADPRLPGLAFSAKEAVYKATYPVAGRYIGFQEAEVVIDEAAGQFRLIYLGDHEPNRVMERAVGHYVFRERYVLSLVIIAHQ